MSYNVPVALLTIPVNLQIDSVRMTGHPIFNSLWFLFLRFLNSFSFVLKLTIFPFLSKVYNITKSPFIFDICSKLFKLHSLLV